MTQTASKNILFRLHFLFIMFLQTIIYFIRSQMIDRAIDDNTLRRHTAHALKDEPSVIYVETLPFRDGFCPIVLARK